MTKKIFCIVLLLTAFYAISYSQPETGSDYLTADISLVSGNEYSGTLCFNTLSDLNATIRVVSDSPDRKLAVTVSSSDITLYDDDLWLETWYYAYNEFREIEIEEEHTLSSSKAVSAVLEKPGVYYLSFNMPDDEDHYSATVTYTITCSSYQSEQITGVNVPMPYVRQVKYFDKTSTDSLDIVDYYDGLGFKIQIRHRGLISPADDVVRLFGYDDLGRESEQWNAVSVPSADNATSRESVIHGARSFYQDDLPFVHVVYERSVRDVITGEFAQGEKWHYDEGGHGITYQYQVNDSSDLKCRKLKVLGERETCSLVDSGFFAAGKLNVRKRIDADENVTYEFRDVFDNILMSRVVTSVGNEDTYYVYDSYGNLCYVLPASVTDASQSLTLSDDSSVLADNAYIYKYDNRNRCVLKKLPGISAVEYLYDSADRLVFWQDSWTLQRGLMHFTMQDVYGRPTLEGTCAALTEEQKNSVRTGNLLASRSVSGSYYGYELPISLSDVTLYNVNYYDDYSHLTEASFSGLTYVMPSEPQKYSSAYSTSSCKGCLTGRLTRVVGDTGQYEPSVFYYDEFGNVVQEVNKDSYDRLIRKQFRYDLAGNLLNSLETVSSGSTTDTYASTYTWKKGSLLNSSNFNLSGKAYAGSAYLYDEVGRLSEIQTASSDFDRRYVYDVQNRAVSQSDYFFMESMSFIDGSLSGSAPSWSGNVSEASYAFTDSDAPSQGRYTYSYIYDSKGQLTDSACHIGESQTPSGCCSEEDVVYDAVGNLLSMQRKGPTSSDVSVIQNTYAGNRLMSSQVGSHTVQFGYDAAGNTTYDGLHDLDITYNHLNLIERISRNDTVIVNYSYLADGTKISALDCDGNGLLYRGSLTYRKEGAEITLESVGYDQGRIVADAPGYNEYRVLVHIPDHLGNVRVVADDESNVLERNGYYPFGSRWKVGSVETANRYRFNGKEEQAYFGTPYSDYGARQYDPFLARWSAPDPLAEKYYSTSPYAFCNNNPVNFVDPDGRDWYEAEDGSVMWRDGNEQSYVDETGKEWENIGQKYTYYLQDGSAIYFYQQNVNGEQQLLSHLFSDEQILVFDSYHSESARDAAFEYYFNPTFSNALKLYLAELKAQWTDPYLLTGAIHIGVSNISHNPIKGFKEHGLHQTINRGFKPKIILSIVEEGNVTHAKGRYGRPQTRYRLGNNVVILDEHGKIITVYGPKPTGNYKK